MSGLSHIESLKCDTFTLNVGGLTTTAPVSFTYTKLQKNITFIPDIVIVSMAAYLDPDNASEGVYNVNCNFIRDNGILVAIPVLPITNSSLITPHITHQFVDNTELKFTVSSTYAAANPGAHAYMVITLEFAKFKSK